MSCNSLIHRSCFTFTLRSGIELRKLRSELTGRSVECSPLSPLAYTLHSRRELHRTSPLVVWLGCLHVQLLLSERTKAKCTRGRSHGRLGNPRGLTSSIGLQCPISLIYQTPSSQAEPFPGPDSSFPPSSLSSRAHWVLASLRWLFCQGMRNSVVITEGDTRRAPWRASLRMPISSLLP